MLLIPSHRRQRQACLCELEVYRLRSRTGRTISQREKKKTKYDINSMRYDEGHEDFGYLTEVKQILA